MIRHCVFVKFRADVIDAERASIVADIVALKAVVPGFLAIEFGDNVSPEGLGRGYSMGFTIDFADALARDAYLVHPDHQAAGGRIVGAAEGGIEGIFVYDFELAG